MNRLIWIGGSVAVAVVAMAIAANARADTRCNRACAPELRDGTGCCPQKKVPPPPVTKKTTKTTKKTTATNKGSKDATKTTTPPIANGPPTTPATPVKRGPSCEGGLVTTGMQCCWPGQKASDAGQCQGTPNRCPSGFEIAGETCAVGAVKSVRDASGIDWLAFPRAVFEMGSRDGAIDAQPPHRVVVSAFQLGKSEITVAQYGACVKAGKCTTTGLGATPVSNWGKAERASHPINDVSWEQASKFCAWAGGRLPTEAEWELAARSGGRAQTYPWGSDDATCEQAVLHDGDLAGCRHESTWPVCSKPGGSSVQGVCDLAGNVAEWVADRYAKDSYQSSPAADPTGPTTGAERVVRGGGWFHPDPRALRAFHRLKYDGALRYPFVGFRCVKR